MTKKFKPKPIPELAKHEMCYIRLYEPSLFGPYFILGIRGDRVLLCRHYYSVNQFKEEFSQWGEPFVVKQNQCILLHTDKPRVKGAGSRDWFMSDYARAILPKEKPTMVSMEVTCPLPEYKEE